MDALTVFLDWELNCQFAGPICALREGYYAAEGLEVTLVPPSAQGGASVLDLVEANPGSVGTVEENLVIAAVSEGRKVRALGAMLQRSPLVLLTLADSPVATCRDLVGRCVAMHADGAAHLRALLYLEGLAPENVELQVGGWTIDDLFAGRFAAVQGYAITEADGLARAGVSVRSIPLRHPDLSASSIVMVTGAQTLGERGSAAERFVRATAAGWQFVGSAPKLAAEHVARVSTEHPDACENLRILDLVGEYIGTPVCGLDRVQWARNIDSLFRAGLLARPVAIDQLLAAHLD